MNTKFKQLLAATAAAGVIAGLAYATPIKDLASPLLSAGTHLSDIATHGTGHAVLGRSFAVSLQTEGPASIATQDGAYTANGVNGWHSHPGMVIVTMISGSIEWFDENCNKKEYHAGIPGQREVSCITFASSVRHEYISMPHSLPLIRRR